MIRCLFIFACLSISLTVCCQLSTGKYYGYDHESVWYKPLKHGKTKAVDSYIEKTLELRTDSTFSFGYTFFNLMSSQGTQSRSCDGRWKMKHDTLLLTSRYSMQNFYTVEERFIPTPENNLIKIAVLDPDTVTPTTWVSAATVDLNSARVGTCHRNDTLYCKADSISRIWLSSSSPYSMEWYYIPKNKNSNYFAFHLKTYCKDDNICLEKAALILKDGVLFPSGWGVLSANQGGFTLKQKKMRRYGEDED